MLELPYLPGLVQPPLHQRVVIRLLSWLSEGPLGDRILRLAVRSPLLMNRGFGRRPLGPGDVVISTYVKSGTNWMMQLAVQTAWAGQARFTHIHQLVPWLFSGTSLGSMGSDARAVGGAWWFVLWSSTLRRRCGSSEAWTALLPVPHPRGTHRRRDRAAARTHSSLLRAVLVRVERADEPISGCWRAFRRARRTRKGRPRRARCPGQARSELDDVESLTRGPRPGF